MSHLFRLMALSWLALCVNWMGDGVWGQAIITFAFGIACYAAAERDWSRTPGR